MNFVRLGLFRIGVLSCILIGLGAKATAEPKSPQFDFQAFKLRQEQIPNICESQFGKSVNFRDPRLLYVLTVTSPVEPVLRVPVGDKLIDGRLLKWSHSSFRDWFSPDYLPTKDEAVPKAYYLRHGGKDVNLSTLYYVWKRGGVELKVSESSSGIVLQIHDSKLNLEKGATRARIVDLLRKVLEIPSEYISFQERPDEKDVFDMPRDWKIPEKVSKGLIFGSYINGNSAEYMALWFLGTSGFVTEQDICLIILRRAPSGHLGQQSMNMVRTAERLGYFNDPAWLDAAIKGPDGKLVERPKALPGNGRDEP